MSTPSPCKEGEFQCGHSQQCIHDDLVCDSKKDCSNHADEPHSCGKYFQCELVSIKVNFEVSLPLINQNDKGITLLYLFIEKVSIE